MAVAHLVEDSEQQPERVSADLGLPVLQTLPDHTGTEKHVTRRSLQDAHTSSAIQDHLVFRYLQTHRKIEA